MEITIVLIKWYELLTLVILFILLCFSHLLEYFPEFMSFSSIYKRIIMVSNLVQPYLIRYLIFHTLYNA